MSIVWYYLTPCGQNIKILKIYLYDVITYELYSSVSNRRGEAIEGGVHIGQFLIEGGASRWGVLMSASFQ